MNSDILETDSLPTPKDVTIHNVQTILYHGRCPDGVIGALFIALACQNAKRPAPRLIPVHHAAFQKLPDLKNQNVIAVDVSMKTDRLLELWKITDGKLMFFEHHKGSFEAVSAIPADNVRFSVSCCASMLVWRWLYDDEPPPAILNYIDDVDTFNFRQSCSRGIGPQLKAALSTCPTQADCFSMVRSWLDRTSVTLHRWRTGAPFISRFIADISTSAALTAKKGVLRGFDHLKAGVLQGVPVALVSDVGNAIARRYDFALIWNWDPLTKITKVMLFSDAEKKDAPDVEVIASAFQGSGHTNASGFASLHTIDVLVYFHRFDISHPLKSRLSLPARDEDF